MTSAISLGGVTWAYDPAEFAWEWPRRVRYVQGVEGSGTTLDRGRVVRDLVITLGSGDWQIMPRDIYQALDARFHQGGVWDFADTAHGVEGTVHIEDLTPGASTLPGLERYTMRLRAVTLTKWRHADYPPAAVEVG